MLYNINMKVIKAPTHRESDYDDNLKVFLGGSIEMGNATDWQDQLISRYKNHNVTFWNPRRDDWDSSWSQDPTVGSPFNEQVTWEMDAQDEADAIVYYFDPNTTSPITLLELGSYGDFNSIVCCPDGYFRKGNVEMFCKRYDIPFVHTFDDLVSRLNEIVYADELRKETE